MQVGGAGLLIETFRVGTKLTSNYASITEGVFATSAIVLVTISSVVRKEKSLHGA